MRKKFPKIDRKKIIEIIKKDPLLTLVVIAMVILGINILISFISSRLNPPIQEQEVISEKASGTNLKPSDFPEQNNFLRLLPEYNEYFGVSNLPLTKDENLKVLVELYSADSRKIFDVWASKFQNLDKIEFIYLESQDSQQLGFSLARSKFAPLIALLPYSTNQFTIKGRFDVQTGVKFEIYFDEKDESSSKAAEEFMNKNNLYKESLTIEYMGDYLEGLDYR